ncbi:hypothetical protein FE848_05230 [Marinobacter sp. 1-3A]|uniref:hypothetical protein n=1 Tax=Marinobacter sp. 1-3A TaxID=2582920 RepID=UPI001907FED8|nr:hypothetical protein [Marinobacter sp. 1-3A]MBK1872619.1 hypothetical protein [Marinobacter sp. 1-3A]
MITRSAVFVSLMLIVGVVYAAEGRGAIEAEVTQVDLDQGVVSLAINDAVVEVGELFVIARGSGHADTPANDFVVLGIENVGEGEAVGKILFGTPPPVGAVSKRFYGIPAVVTDRAGAFRPVLPTLRSRFPDLLWQEENEDQNGVPLLRFQIVESGQAVATYNNTWLIGVVQTDAKTNSVHFSGESSSVAPFVKLPTNAKTLSALRSGDAYYFAAEDGGRIKFFIANTDGSVRNLAAIEIPRREKVIRMDWYAPGDSRYLLLNQWNGRRVSSSLIELKEGEANVIGFIPLLLGLQDLDSDGIQETILGQSFYSEEGLGSEIYKISVLSDGIEKTNYRKLGRYAPMFRVIGTVVQGKSEPLNMVTVSQGEVSLLPTGDAGPHLDYEIGKRVAGASIIYDVSPELVFSPRRTLFLPSLLFRSSRGALNIGIPQESSAVESMVGAYDTRVDWLTLETGRSPKTKSISFRTPAPVNPVSGNTGLFFLSPDELTIQDDNTGFETLVYRAVLPFSN